MQIVSDGYLTLIQGSHQVVTEASVWKGGERLVQSLPILSGSVTLDAFATTRAKLSLTLPPMLTMPDGSVIPSTPTHHDHPLAHYGQDVRIRQAVLYPGGQREWVHLGRYRIEGHDKASLLHDGSVSIEGLSHEAYLAEAEDQDRALTVSGQSCQALIGQLIRTVIPSADLQFTNTADRRVPTTTFDRDYWRAITSLARSIGAVVYCDGMGIFHITDAPTVETEPVWTFRPGRGGNLVSATSSGNREGVYNEVVVTNDNASGDVPPVSAVARDMNPASPTRWGDPGDGAYGRVSYRMEIPTLTTVNQAQDAADAALARLTGAAEQLDISSVPNAALEPLDCITVMPDPSDGRTARRHIIDSISIPLVPGDAFTITTRNLGAIDEALGEDD